MSAVGSPSAPVAGLIVNADDWGAARATTDLIHAAIDEGLVSSTSAMVHMADARRAAGLARALDLDCGLHLNLTLPFDAADVPRVVRERQRRVVGLLGPGAARAPHRLHSPGAQAAISAAVADQISAFVDLYGDVPTHVDGHEHVHLLLPVLRVAALRGLGVSVRAAWAPPTVGHGARTGPRGAALRAQARGRDVLLTRAHPVPAVYRSVVEVLPELGGDPALAEALVDAARAGPVELVCHPSFPGEPAALRGATHRDLLARTRRLRWRDLL